MTCATVEHIGQTINRIIGESGHLAVTEQMALVKNYFLNNVGSFQVSGEFSRWFEHLSNSGVIDHILKEGDSAPDFTLASITGQTVSLKKYLKRGPVIVVFYRGVWCPFCGLYLKTLQRYLSEFNKYRASILAISPQTPDHSMNVADMYGLSYQVLSDMGNIAARKFGLVYRMPENIASIYQYIDIYLASFNGDDSNELPIAATYVIGQDGNIRGGFINIDFMVRPNPDRIIDILDAIR